MMTSKQRQSLQSTLRDFFRKAEAELQTYHENDRRLHDLMQRQQVGDAAMRVYSQMIVPNQETIQVREEQLRKLEKQISLLDNVSVETMTNEEFQQYINS